MSATSPSAPDVRRPDLEDGAVTLPDGPRLALRRAEGAARPFVLVHGLASNARLWDGVGRRLAAAGHEVVAVDLRGHGGSEQTDDGHTTRTAATDLVALFGALSLTGERTPVLAGQSWGGNVVLDVAARHGGVAAVALVDGGWIRLRDRFADFDECWGLLAPPEFRDLRRPQIEAWLAASAADWPEEGRAGTLANFAENADGTLTPHLTREHHRDILRSMWDDDVRDLYPLVAVPALLMPAVPVVVAAEAEDDQGGTEGARHPAAQEALRALPDAEISWYVGAHHDLHAQQPERVAADLLALAQRAEDARATSAENAESANPSARREQP